MVTTESDVGSKGQKLQADKLRECIAALDEIVVTLEACCTPGNPASIDELQVWAERRVHAAEITTRLEHTTMACIFQLSGTRDAPLLRLCGSHPAAAGEIRTRLGRIAEARAALAIIDERRRELLERARRMVRSYASALFPMPEAYGRNRPAPVPLPHIRGTHA